MEFAIARDAYCDFWGRLYAKEAVGYYAKTLKKSCEY